MIRNSVRAAVSAIMILSAGVAQADVTIGASAPDFRLTDMHGKPVQLSHYKGKTIVLEWTNPKCPFVRKHYLSGNMPNLQRTFTKRGVVWLSINSAAPGREGFSTPEEARATSLEQKGAPTDVLLDPTGQVGHLYGARTTPHMFVISTTGKILYMGGIDSIPSNKQEDLPRARNFVSAALNEVLAGKPVSVPTSMPYGCSVKYAL